MRKARRVACRAVCVVLATAFLALAAIRAGTSETVSDTRCGSIAWGRTGRQVCDASNWKRELQFVGLFLVGVGLFVASHQCKTRSSASSNTDPGCGGTGEAPV